MTRSSKFGGWLSIGLWGLVIAGCSRTNAYVEPPPPEVTVATPLKRSVTEYLEFTGLTQPMETVEIRARVKGFLQERHFVEGGEVKEGQLLLVIDEEPFQIQLDAARTHLKEADAALEQATASKAREVAQAQLKLSQSQLLLAQQEEQRQRDLFERKINTQADLQQTLAARESREADVESARARWEQEVASYDTTILSNRAAVESAKVAVRNAELDLSYCRMHAPISGRISRVNVDIGNLVGDGQSSVLATIVKIDPIYAYATISEADVLRTPALRGFGTGGTQQKVSVELGVPSQTGFPVAGELNYSDPSFDGTTGTLRTRGVFPNEDRSLLPGMFVRMRIPVAEKADSLLVPERALGTDQSGNYVLVVGAEDKVEYRAVKTSVAINGLRVVEGQLAEADRVIVEGLLRARPGTKVTPLAMKEPATEVAIETSLSGRR
ncbi:MAG TPA: efflux RND transporter periplasmic adaptor subunit [Planctomycetaceae bacterium]|nr:efflux RND transporter periplasmic adaptor subunit [Planctomycetaceae bacterium]